jgi:hypothetical protein
MLSNILLFVIMLSVIMLSVVMLNVVMLNVLVLNTVHFFFVTYAYDKQYARVFDHAKNLHPIPIFTS